MEQVTQQKPLESLQHLAAELEAANDTRYAEVVRKIRAKDYDRDQFLTVPTLVADLMQAHAPQELLVRVVRADFVPPRPASPASDEQTQLAVAAAMCARREAAQMDARDGLTSDARKERVHVVSLRTQPK